MKNKIKTGICSVTFRKLNAAELVALVKKAGLDAIEWGGDVHVPPGAIDIAEETLARTRDAGLEVSSYGSYYRVVDAAGVVQDFRPVLESALALETDTIRIWPGAKGTDTADETYWKAITDGIRLAAELAAAQKVRVALEFHPKTLTDTNETTLRLLKDVNHSNLYMYWQPAYWISDMNYRLAGLDALRHRILNLHVYHWAYEQGADFYAGIRRRPLAEGKNDWPQYLSRELAAGFQHFALIEFVMNDSQEQFLEDAKTLKSWLHR